MKKAITIGFCLAAALCLWMYNVGRNEGIRYTVQDSSFFIVSYEDDEARIEGYDTWLYIETQDGPVYESGLYIG